MNCRGDEDIDAKRSRPSIGKPVMGHARKERVVLFGTDQRITSGPAAKRPHSKAEYMTAPERFADSQIPLAPRAPSIHVRAFMNCRGDEDIDAKRSRPSIGKPVMGHARKERVVLFGTDQRITSGPAAKRPHSKAEYMTAPERFADSQIPLAPRAPSIHAPRAPSIHDPKQSALS